MQTHHPHTHTHQHSGRIARNKVTIAAVTVGALALAGGSLALWSDSASLSTASVVSGHLDLDLSDQYVYDISPLQSPEIDSGALSWTADSATEITDLGDFRFSPGDVVAVATEIVVDLEGNNLAATLEASIPTDSPVADQGFTVTPVGVIQVASGADLADVIAGVTTAATEQPFLFVASETDDNTYYAVYTIEFDATSDLTTHDTDFVGTFENGTDDVGYMGVTLADILADTTVTLQQVRTAS